jgi:pilus assembly protein CpaC
MLLSGGQPMGVVLANLLNSGYNIDVLIQALEERGHARNLAEPNLVALSGDTADFLAGGEFPYPVPTDSGQPAVEYKEFGVRLAFTPTVLKNGNINLVLEPEVSTLDFSQPTTFGAPALSSRRARTTIELRDGQSFAIAGLLQNTSSRQLSQVPWIGNIPVLGALFRSTSFQNNETDLVIIVTPHLVQPGAPGDHIATPLDRSLPANDPDLFLMGQMEIPKEYRHYVEAGHGIQGPYGHMLGMEFGFDGIVGKVGK